MTKIHAFKAKALSPERYEKHISELEQENAQLRESAKDASSRFQAQRVAHNKKRLEHYQGLMNFLSGLHGQLGKVQNDLLSHIGKLNALVMTENENGVKDMAKKLQEIASITASLGHGGLEREVKTSALPMLEDDD